MPAQVNEMHHGGPFHALEILQHRQTRYKSDHSHGQSWRMEKQAHLSANLGKKRLIGDGKDGGEDRGQWKAYVGSGWQEGKFTNHNGALIHFVSKSPPPDHLPTGIVVFIHGINGNVHTPQKRWVGDRLVGRGFVFWSFDQQGFGKSVINCSPGIVEDSGRSCELDVSRVVDMAMAAHPGLPVSLLGESWGGAMAVLHGISLQHRLGSTFKGCVLIAPAIDEDVAPSGLKRALLEYLLLNCCPMTTAFTPPVRYDKTYRVPDDRERMKNDPLLRFPGGLPLKGAAEAIYMLERLRKRLHEVRFPFVILHGTADQVVPLSGSKLLMETSSTMACDKELIIIEGGWHDLLLDPSTSKVILRVEEKLANLMET